MQDPPGPATHHAGNTGGVPGCLPSAGSQISDRLPPHPQPVDDVEANVQSTSVQQDQEPLVYFKLPDDIAERHVLVLDPILSSGYTVVRAIETLLVRFPLLTLRRSFQATSTPLLYPR